MAGSSRRPGWGESVLVGVDASRTTVQPRTGTEGYSYHLIRELLALGASHRFRLYFNAPPVAGDFPVGAAELRTMPFPRLWTHLRLSLEMLTHPPDLLFVPAHVLPLAHPRRSVVTVHDLGYLYWPRAHPRKRWWYLHLSTRYNARAAKLVIADSAATHDDLVRHYGVPADKIRVVHLGHGPAHRPPSAEEVRAVRARHGVVGDYVLTVGTLHPRKNLGRLFDAFALARAESGVPCRLVVVGAAGWQAEEIHRQAAELGADVQFLGYVPEAELPALLGGAMALAFPSLYEGFGLPALEAMACGTPVVASNTSSLPEVVGDAGLLVPPTDVAALSRALGAVLRDAGLRAELRARGLDRASRFTWRRCAAETLAVLEEAGR